MPANPKFSDLIKTIDEDEEVENFSEDSDQEVEVSLRLCSFDFSIYFCVLFKFQPSKQKKKDRIDFDTDFEFVNSVEEYNKDAWNDLAKYVKRKAKTKTDDKIKKLRKQNVATDDQEDVKPEIEEASDISLSEDELKHDNIKTKEKKKTKKVAKEVSVDNDDGFFEDVELPDEHTSFYQMNLSRPLLKAIGEMKFVHPTPIQAATIPLALLG